MDSYTKLFSSLITSTIWQEDNPTRILWITMLALSDSVGKVEGSIPGLARMAGITIADCEKAMAKLQSPDPYSRTKEHEGRRVEDADGGWIILNRAKYRDKHADRKEYYKRYMRDYRIKNRVNKSVKNVNKSKQKLTQEEEEEEEEIKEPPYPPIKSQPWPGFENHMDGGVKDKKEKEEEELMAAGLAGLEELKLKIGYKG